MYGRSVEYRSKQNPLRMYIFNAIDQAMTSSSSVLPASFDLYVFYRYHGNSLEEEYRATSGAGSLLYPIGNEQIRHCILKGIWFRTNNIVLIIVIIANNNSTCFLSAILNSCITLIILGCINEAFPSAFTSDSVLLRHK